jgi:hypothetical protein
LAYALQTANKCSSWFHGSRKGMAFTYFAWRPDEPRRTAEIALDFREECPTEIGQKILDCIRLPLKPGLSLEAVCQILGEPELSDLSHDGEGFVRFVCGEKCPYFIGCTITHKDGLMGVVVFRRDYWQSLV